MSRTNLKIIKTFPQIKSKRNLPANFNERDSHLFSNEFERVVHPTYVYNLRRINILGDMLFSIERIKFFSEHTFSHAVPPNTFQKMAKLKYFLKPFSKIEKAIWILDNWSFSYFHWITDALPRLIASESELRGHKVLLPKAYINSNFITQSLKQLKVEYEYFDPYKRLYVQELLLPSHTAITGNYNREIINIVRNRFDVNDRSKPEKKIYISRAKANKRKVLNEEQLVHSLLEFGYEIHHFENYDFKTQVNLMKHSTHLISLHGAGLTNMLFMSPKSKILELRTHNESLLNCYFTLASELNHEYYYLLNSSDSEVTHVANITVNIEKLEQILRLMEL